MDKICKDCHKNKSLEEFHKSPSGKDGRKTICKQCWAPKNKIRHLQNRYNLTKQEYDELFSRHNNECDICGSNKYLHIDHCHTSKKIRGLLCNKCNQGLGLFNDNLEILSLAMEYLNATKI